MHEFELRDSLKLARDDRVVVSHIDWLVAATKVVVAQSLILEHKHVGLAFAFDQPESRF